MGHLTGGLRDLGHAIHQGYDTFKGHAQHGMEALKGSYEHLTPLQKALLIGGGTAALGAGGYAAYDKLRGDEEEEKAKTAGVMGSSMGYYAPYKPEAHQYGGIPESDFLKHQAHDESLGGRAEHLMHAAKKALKHLASSAGDAYEHLSPLEKALLIGGGSAALGAGGYAAHKHLSEDGEKKHKR